jgi:hypothetical protein
MRFFALFCLLVALAPNHPAAPVQPTDPAAVLSEQPFHDIGPDKTVDEEIAWENDRTTFASEDFQDIGQLQSWNHEKVKAYWQRIKEQHTSSGQPLEHHDIPIGNTVRRPETLESHAANHQSSTGKKQSERRRKFKLWYQKMKKKWKSFWRRLKFWKKKRVVTPSPTAPPIPPSPHPSPRPSPDASPEPPLSKKEIARLRLKNLQRPNWQRTASYGSLSDSILPAERKTPDLSPMSPSSSSPILGRGSSCLNSPEPDDRRIDDPECVGLSSPIHSLQQHGLRQPLVYNSGFDMTATDFQDWIGSLPIPDFDSNQPPTRRVLFPSDYTDPAGDISAFNQWPQINPAWKSEVDRIIENNRIKEGVQTVEGALPMSDIEIDTPIKAGSQQ